MTMTDHTSTPAADPGAPAVEDLARGGSAPLLPPVGPALDSRAQAPEPEAAPFGAEGIRAAGTATAEAPALGAVSYGRAGAAQVRGPADPSARHPGVAPRG